MQLIAVNLQNLPSDWTRTITKVHHHRAKVLELLLNGWEVYRSTESEPETHCYLKYRYLDEIVTGCSRTQSVQLASRMASEFVSLIVKNIEHKFLELVLYPYTVKVHRTIESMYLRQQVLTLKVSTRPGWFNLDYRYDELRQASRALAIFQNFKDHEVLDDINDPTFVSGATGYSGQDTRDHYGTAPLCSPPSYELPSTPFTR